jgi:septum formation protein
MTINTFFILASSSKSRKMILKKLGLNFEDKDHGCDENYYKKKFLKLKYTPSKISLELSKLKAKSINIKNKLIVGSDTIININREIINKAKNVHEARKNIKQLSGKTHTINSSIAAYYNNKLIWSCTSKTKVKIRKLNNKEINEYIKKCGPTILNSVGCYQVEKMGPIIIENINGDYFNVMGFPLFLFLFFLKKFNIRK